MRKGYNRRQIIGGIAGITSYGALGIEAALESGEIQESKRWRLEGKNASVKYMPENEEDITLNLEGLKAGNTEAILEAEQEGYHETRSLHEGSYDGDIFGEIEGLPDFNLYEVGDVEQSWGAEPYVEIEFEEELKGDFL